MGEFVRLCTKCKQYKEDELFSNKMKIKNTGTCKLCKKIYAKKYRQDKSVRISEYKREYRDKNLAEIEKYKKKHREENKDKYSKYSKDYRENNRIKTRAKDKIAKALKKGTLKKECCVACFAEDKIVNFTNIDGHHPDYNKPLEVIWLCRKHHLQEHKKIKLINKNNPIMGK